MKKIYRLEFPFFLQDAASNSVFSALCICAAVSNAHTNEELKRSEFDGAFSKKIGLLIDRFSSCFRYIWEIGREGKLTHYIKIITFSTHHISSRFYMV